MTTATVSSTSISSATVSPGSATAEPRDDVVAVAEPPNQARYVIIAVAVSSIIFLLGVGGGLLLFYGEWALAFGVGIFTAFWGGPGFGIMAGMALYNLRVERLEAAGTGPVRH